jgi:hypothetical protein
VLPVKVIAVLSVELKGNGKQRQRRNISGYKKGSDRRTKQIGKKKDGFY